jgi:hypothetical protein
MRTGKQGRDHDGSRENKYLELKGMLPTFRGLPQIDTLPAKVRRGRVYKIIIRHFNTNCGKTGASFGLKQRPPLGKRAILGLVKPKQFGKMTIIQTRGFQQTEWSINI